MRTYVKMLRAAESRKVSLITPCVRSGDSSGTGGGLNVFDFVERFLNDPAGYQESSFTTATDSRQIIAFPVPATETLCFQSEQMRTQPFMVILYDVSGKELGRRDWLPDEQQCCFNVSRLTSGLYFYSAISHGETYYGKVSVQH